MDEKISGTIENIIFQNKERGFCVLDLAVADELVTVVGELFDVSVGEELSVWGEYGTHPSFGRQFKAKAFERVLPSGAAAVLKYLSNGAVTGVGPAIARRIVDAFKEDALLVIEKKPELLAEIKGISRKKADEISTQFRRKFGVREILAKLAALGIETSDALSLYRAFGEHTVELVNNNPYIICGYPAYKDFSVADAIAQGLGIEGEHVSRLRAGLVYILRHNMQNGHTCLPSEKLIDLASDFLEVSRDSVEIALYDAVEEKMFGTALVDGDERTFLSESMRCEKYIAERLLFLSELEFPGSEDPKKMVADFEKRENIEYETIQREAIMLSLKCGAVVITGGPGTGKTTALNAIIALCEQQGDKVLLAAPTGRAAKRLNELTNREAKTIHRLLEVDYSNLDTLKFVHDEQNTLKCDVVIVDEMSMVDVALFEALLKGINPQCRLVMVGDFNQLPSVGAGNLLQDIIDSGVCETIELVKIFRQAAQSMIVTNAHRIVAGEMPDVETRDRDFFFLQADKEHGAKLICDLVAARLPRAYKLNPFSDIQVLTPSRIGMLGTVSLNEELRKRLNPHSAEKNEVTVMGAFFREGDRIMQTKNNYDIKWKRDDNEQGIGMFNGDIGVMEKIDKRLMTAVCRFDDRTATYTFEQLRQLEPAYAVTVHKSQGSEFPVVVLALCDFSRKLRYRNLLYTAVTRARKLLVIVGEQDAMNAMVENNRRMLRFTGLRAFLAKEE
ncbi:MAG: ATP-dependent RecD-like DNA helicase [Oscillospiraceae bacterium]